MQWTHARTTFLKVSSMLNIVVETQDLTLMGPQVGMMIFNVKPSDCIHKFDHLTLCRSSTHYLYDCRLFVCRMEATNCLAQGREIHRLFPSTAHCIQCGVFLLGEWEIPVLNLNFGGEIIFMKAKPPFSKIVPKFGNYCRQIWWIIVPSLVKFCPSCLVFLVVFRGSYNNMEPCWGHQQPSSSAHSQVAMICILA